MVAMNESNFKMSTEDLATQISQICDDNSKFTVVTRGDSYNGRIDGKIIIETREGMDNLTIHVSFDEVKAGTKQVGEHGIKQLYKIDRTSCKIYNALVLAGIKPAN